MSEELQTTTRHAYWVLKLHRSVSKRMHLCWYYAGVPVPDKQIESQTPRMWSFFSLSTTTYPKSSPKFDITSNYSWNNQNTNKIHNKTTENQSKNSCTLLCHIKTKHFYLKVISSSVLIWQFPKSSQRKSKVFDSLTGRVWPFDNNVNVIGFECLVTARSGVPSSWSICTYWLGRQRRWSS